ncbi:acetyl-CoA C-acyltransferase [bacterium]|nr:acetyl-CoA C-acyltransferase [bacterium]
MTEVVIVSALRTAIGAFQGGFSNTPAHMLGAAVLKETVERTKVAPGDVSEVILGQVLTCAQGQNPGRQAVIHAGFPETVPGWGLNQVCGSGLRAVALGYQAILEGGSSIVIAGGQENMTLAPYAAHVRAGLRMGDGKLVDTMVFDGLTDAFSLKHMGITAENIAKKFSISREEQDAFAAASQQKAEAAQKAGKFKDEIVPFTVKGRKGDTIIDTDEHPKHGTTMESLASLRAAFDKEGSVTAGNASGINDGAAAVMLMTKEEAQKRGLEIIATIRGWAHAGVSPDIMGTGPIPATQKLLKRIGWSVGDLDLIEANEAFAAQALCVSKELGFDASKVNVNGGAIALGHPIGASGCRVLVTLLHEMKKRSAKKGLATLCIGGGMGVALAVER